MKDLIKKAKNGDVIAFTKLIKSLEKDLYRIAYTKLKNNDDINDAIQNTMFMIYKNIKKLKHEEYYKTWIIKILINECNKILKENIKRNKFLEPSALEMNIEIVSKDSEFDNFLGFNSLISRFDDDEQLIFTLYYKDKYSCSEISKITGIKEGTIKSKLSRGRLKIENSLKKEDLKWN